MRNDTWKIVLAIVQHMWYVASMAKQKRLPKIHCRVRLPVPIVVYIKKGAKKSGENFTAALTRLLISAIASEINHAA